METCQCKKWETGEREFLPFSMFNFGVGSVSPPSVTSSQFLHLRQKWSRRVHRDCNSPLSSSLPALLILPNCHILSFNTSQSEKGFCSQILTKGGINCTYYQFTSVCHEAASLQESISQSEYLSRLGANTHSLLSCSYSYSEDNQNESCFSDLTKPALLSSILN